MRRREALQLAGASALSLISASPALAQVPTSARKPKIIMVHGSWHWGACFQKVSNRLAETGYAVATPDLISHGYSDRTYDSFSTIGEYAQPVEQMLQNATEPLVLVGHSMGGVTLTYLAEKYPDKISKLVYLAAFMVPKGKRALDYILLNHKIPAAKELFEVVSKVNDGRGLQLDLKQLDLVKTAFCADCSDRDIDIAAKNILPITSTVPDQTISEITSERYGRIPRLYIECTLDNAVPIETQRLMINDVPGAKVVSIATSHSSFFSKPAELARIISDNA